MKQTFNELIAYLKHPVLEKDENKNSTYRLLTFFHLLIICLLTGILISPIYALIESVGLIDMKKHAMTDIMKEFSKGQVFALVVIAAPFFEELLFRAPLTLFKSKFTFKIAFYTLAILFGLIHITNFEMTTNVLVLTPILVLPQILLGGYLGFIRVRFGLLWSICLHATYNGILMGGALLFGLE